MIEISFYNDEYFPIFVNESNKYEISQQIYAILLGWA